MSDSKIQSVIDFPTPTISKHLKSFLGNYFRDFVRNHSSIVKPLHSLLQNYNETKKIVLTVETLAAFTNIKTEISNCTTMHFLSEIDPMYSYGVFTTPFSILVRHSTLYYDVVDCVALTRKVVSLT